ncbi:MAG: carboxypeptidase-like regulatory domain-containing protein [Muribaculaceae bacterium]|nr:carboxypeptidase-like regulatory domain-containing protein [Muribaculaceae bacterium]
MKRFRLFIICILLGLLSLTAATPSELRGTVKDAQTGEPIAGAIVKAKGVFTSTDGKGDFILKLKADIDSLSFRSMGYESLTLPVAADMSEVCLNQKATQLNDVIVEAPDIYEKGDTLVFNVARYTNAKDNAIIDVIKRLPGIKVRDDGTIEYQGKPINKFYLDGNDFIGGQYGLATDNISHKDVKSVEIMENHQPVKALEGIEFPEEAGINLKLKEDARSRWVGVAQAASGIQPLLYDGSLFAMRMARKLQNMFTFKADNTGWNPANEIRDHNFGEMFSMDYASSLWPEYINADNINVPLSEKRTRDNLSWLANAITAWKAGDTSMRLKLNYMGDRLDYTSGVTTDYFSSLIPTFIQNNSQRIQNNDLSLQFNSETNKKGYYMKNQLTLSGKLDHSNSDINGSYEISQSVERKYFRAENDLKLVKRNEKKLFTLISRNTFSRRPDHLLVSGEENALQNVRTTDFRSTTESRIGKLTRFWKFYLTAGVDLNYHRINTLLIGLDGFNNSGVHKAFLFNIYATPQADYERNGWRMSFRMPVKWMHYSVAGQHDYINVSPQYSIRRQLTSKSELSGSVSYGLSSPQPYLNIDNPILSDYRNLFIAHNPDRYSHELRTSMSYRYRNPIKSMFFNISAGYSHHQSHVMTNQKFINDFIISTYTDRLSNTDTWNLNGGMSKGLGHSKMVAGMDMNSSLSSASSMRDGEEIAFRQISTGVKPYFKGSILRWLSMNYEAEYGFSNLDINDMSNSSHSLRQTLFVTISLNDFVHFTAGAEHFLTSFPEGNIANMTLLDASAVWRVSNRVRLSLTANNLLNKRSYEYVTYGTLSRSKHVFGIRQRFILASLQYRF